MLRSAMAVIAGILVLTVSSFAIEALMATWVGPGGSSGNAFGSAAMTTYTLLCVVVGGYVTARVARRAPRGHAAVMGAIELLFTMGAMVQLGQTGRIAAWLPGILLMMPAALAGAMIRARQTAHGDTAAPLSQW